MPLPQKWRKKSLPKKALLFHKLVDGLTQFVNGLFVSGGHGVHHAVAQMILQDHLAGVIQSGADSGQLYQNIGAILSVFYHAFHLFQMTDGPGQTVDDGFLVFMDMTVGMGDAVLMQIGMAVIMIVVVIVTQGKHLLCRILTYYTPKLMLPQALPGVILDK